MFHFHQTIQVRLVLFHIDLWIPFKKSPGTVHCISSQNEDSIEGLHLLVKMSKDSAPSH